MVPLLFWSNTAGSSSDGKRTSWIGAVALVGVSIVAILVCLEVGLRTYDLFTGKGFFGSPRNLYKTDLAFLDRKIIPYRIFGPSFYRMENGIRSIDCGHKELYPVKKGENTFRIVFFGGSTTRQPFPQMIQEILRSRIRSPHIEVINVSYMAYATPHSLILLLLDVLSWQPDLVVLSHNINDLTAGWFPNFTFDYSNKYGTLPWLPDYESLVRNKNAFYQHSELYWFVHWRCLKIKNLLVQRQFVDGKLAGSSSIRRTSYGPRPAPAATAVFTRNLESFVTICKANNIMVILATQPLQPSEEYFELHMAHKSYNDRVQYPLHDEFVKHHAYFNDIVRNVADRYGTWFVDNDQLLGGRKEYFIDFCHYSAAGNELLAGNYVDFLEKKIRDRLADQGRH